MEEKNEEEALNNALTVGDESEQVTPSSGVARRVRVERPGITQDEFDQRYGRTEKSSRPMKDMMKRQISKRRCTARCVKSVLRKIFPFVGILKNYSVRADLPNDVIAGLTIGIMQIPQGMAYAMLAELAPIYGLYLAFFPAIVYFFTGTSRHVSVGPVSIISLMVGSVVVKYGHVCCPSDGSNMTPKQAAFCTEGAPPTGGGTNITWGGDGNVSWLTRGVYNGSFFNVTVTATPSYSGPDEFDQCKAKIAAALALMTGLLQLAMGILRLGFVTIYLSEPLTRGFITGAACHVFSSQVKYVFGLKVKRFSGAFKLIKMYIDLFSKIARTNIASLIISLTAIIILYLTKEFINPRVKKKIKVPVPIDLIVVVIATVASHFGHFHERFNVKVVGHIPRGLPAPEAPPPEHYGMVIGDCVAIAVVAFALSISMAKLFAKKHSYKVDSNQELLAHGLTNSVSSLFNCFPAAACLSRSIVQEGTGGVTQVAGLVSCCLILVVLLALGPLFTQLPNAVLAAVILVALKNIFKQVTDLKKLWSISKYDFVNWLVVFLATVIMDVDIGLGVGIAFSLLTVIFRTQRPSTRTLGQLPETDMYRDQHDYKAAKEVPGISIIRYEGALYYANGEHFVHQLFQKSGLNPRWLKIKEEKIKRANKENMRGKTSDNKTEKEVPFIQDGESIEMSVRFQHPQPNIHHIIVDCGAMGFIDNVGVTTLRQIIQEYNEVGVTMFLAHCSANIRDMLEVSGFFKEVDKDRLFPSIHYAVIAAMDTKTNHPGQ